MRALRDAAAALAWRPLLGASVGAGLGAGWALSVGCLTGLCPLTSNPWFMAAFGAWLGWSVLSPSKKAAGETSGAPRGAGVGGGPSGGPRPG